jgi:hypothetical protein
MSWHTVKGCELKVGDVALAVNFVEYWGPLSANFPSLVIGVKRIDKEFRNTKYTYFKVSWLASTTRIYVQTYLLTDTFTFDVVT